MMPRKIVILTVSLAPGGAETVVVQLASALRVSGWRVSVVSMLEPTAFRQELESAGVAVVSFGMQPGRINLRAIVKLLLFLRRERPDLLHSHMFHANILARAVRVLLGIPIVSTIHSEIECSHRKKSATTREWIYRLTNLVCGRVTAVSERVRERYVREKIIPANCIEVVGNGVDLDRIHPVPERRHETRSTLGWNHTFVWLAVGRLELAKDYPTLIRAFLTIRQRFPEARLVIAGDGRLRKQLEQQIQVASAESAICLLGWRDDIPSLVNACDALVMSSSWEGAQLAVLEAGAGERAVVATAVGVAPQAVVAGKTGFLVPPGDAAALADAMADLMKLPTGELRDMGREARKHVANGFSLQSAIHHYLRVYREVLEISR